MAESLGMELVNKRTEEIIKVMSIHDFTLIDLRRIQKRLATMAGLVDDVIAQVPKDLEGEHGAQKSSNKEGV